MSTAARGRRTGDPVPSLWAPLRVRAFRVLWFAQLATMLATWMQTVGAQWLLVEEPGSAALVALVQVTSMVPMLLFALPAGALADILDRRRLIIAAQLLQLVVGSSLTTLTALGLVSPPLLLTHTFLLGACLACTLPAYQALVQELVPREQVRMAAALSGVAVNGARAVGPAIAGLLLARMGAASVFAVTAVSSLLFIAVLLRTAPRLVPAGPAPERFGSALRAGGRYVRNSPAVRRMLLRVVLFVLPGAAVWALLPLVVEERLEGGSSGFGLLLGSLGAGAVLGAAVLPALTSRLSQSRVLVLSAVLFSVSLVACVTIQDLLVLALLLVPGGMAWLFVLMGITGALQVFLPQWVRARGLSTYNVVFAASQAAGALLWGCVAHTAGLVPTFLAAAVVMLVGAVTVAIWPFPDVAHLDRDPAVFWRDPALEFQPDPREGPVVVTVRYSVTSESEQDFLHAMELVRRSRLQTGATACDLYRDGAEPTSFLLVQTFRTWEEHLRQHTGGRLTGTDRAHEELAHALAEEVETTHLFPASQRLPEV